MSHSRFQSPLKAVSGHYYVHVDAFASLSPEDLARLSAAENLASRRWPRAHRAYRARNRSAESLHFLMQMRHHLRVSVPLVAAITLVNEIQNFSLGDFSGPPTPIDLSALKLPARNPIDQLGEGAGQFSDVNVTI